MTIGMTMISRGRMLRDSYRIFSARGNCKVLTETDFFLLPCTPNIRFLAGITSKFIYNAGAQVTHNEAGSLSLNRKNDEFLNELLKQNLNSICGEAFARLFLENLINS